MPNRVYRRDAVNARKKAIETLGETPERLLKYAEALSYAKLPKEVVAKEKQALAKVQ